MNFSIILVKCLNFLLRVLLHKRRRSGGCLMILYLMKLHKISVHLRGKGMRRSRWVERQLGLAEYNAVSTPVSGKQAIKT